MIRSTILTASFTALLISTPAKALTGADLIGANKTFSSGYIWGSMESLISIYDEGGSTARLTHQRKCLRDAGMTANIAYEAVTRYVLAEPSRLKDPASFAVAGFLSEMCGRVPQ